MSKKSHGSMGLYMCSNDEYTRATRYMTLALRTEDYFCTFGFQ